MSTNTSDFVGPVKDPDSQHPVASQWRPTLSRIVSQLAKGDYSPSLGLGPSVDLPKEAAEQIRQYLDNFGESLTDLPDATWATSVATWQVSHWELIVDLWTLESGRRDLIPAVTVYEEEFNADSQGKRILIHRSGREQTSGTASITHSVTIPIGRAALD